MSHNYNDRDELAKKMGFDSWEAFLNSEIEDILKKEEHERLNNFRSYWSWLDDKENLEENIQNYISRNNLEGKFRADIKKEDPLFYRALINRRLRNLLPEPEPKKGKTIWSWLDDNENLEEDFYNYVLENNLEFKEISLHDPGLYNAVKRRGLEDIALKCKVFTRALPRIKKYSKIELKFLQDQIYQRLSELEEE